MANMLRVAKASSEWLPLDLKAYNITVVVQTKEDFFGTSQLQLPTNPALVDFMTTKKLTDVSDSEVRKLFFYLIMVTSPCYGEESAMVNLVSKLLEKFGYDEGDRIIFTERGMPFLNCGETCRAQTDICIIDNRQVVLLVQGDKNSPYPECQVIAAAIAAYEANNRARRTFSQLGPLPSMTFPAITMEGKMMFLYKITVTEELSKAVQFGTFPAIETRVLRYNTLVSVDCYSGMYPLYNRRELFACLEAFKKFL